MLICVCADLYKWNFIILEIWQATNVQFNLIMGLCNSIKIDEPIEKPKVQEPPPLPTIEVNDSDDGFWTAMLLGDDSPMKKKAHWY